jgi:hypothetical protein
MYDLAGNGDLKMKSALPLHRRDRGKRTNQNGQHQKSTQEKCHLAHWGLLRNEFAVQRLPPLLTVLSL